MCVCGGSWRIVEAGREEGKTRSLIFDSFVFFEPLLQFGQLGSQPTNHLATLRLDGRGKKDPTMLAFSLSFSLSSVFLFMKF